ncbi:MAG: NAD-dependent succinate-semialdehyde dehydrogenase [Bacteroidota bacterium]
MPFQTLNPYTSQLIQTFPNHSEKQVNELLQKAANAFKEWKRTTFEQRSLRMLACATILLNKKQAFAQLITLEMGKPFKEAVAEIEKCAVACEYYAHHAEKLLCDEVVETKVGKSIIAYQPLGAVLAIMPWNFPFWQVFRFACPTLMAGNVGLLKHAPNVPQCALAIEAIFREAGFPEGVFTNLFIEPAIVENVIASDVVHAVTLTGSEMAGSKVASIAGRNLKKTVLELGGSDPFIVLADADLAHAAQMAVKGRMLNTGQSCICAKRFIVVERVAEEFIHLFQQHMQQLKGGNPMAEETNYGPLARQDLTEKLRQQVQRSVALGAKVVYEAELPAASGFFFPPTILTQVGPGMPAYEEELFGPVATILLVKDEAEAIAVANDSRYGLGASVWTKDAAAGERIAKQIEAGNVFINDLVRSDPKLPFGGIKKSGYGRELSYLGIREFVNIQTIVVA